MCWLLFKKKLLPLLSQAAASFSFSNELDFFLGHIFYFLILDIFLIHLEYKVRAQKTAIATLKGWKQ